MLASPVPRASLLYVVKRLPAAPRILARLGELLLEPDIGLDAIVDLLRRDAALTAQVIRVANSASYGSVEALASLEQALARVGLAEVYRLTGIAAVAQMTDQNLDFYGISGRRLRENSLLTGLIIERLARPAGIDARAAYTAGLLRSTGKLALDRLTREPAYRGRHVRSESTPLAEWEAAVVGLSNGEAAAIILEAWNFPARVSEPIRDQYCLRPEAPALTSLLNLAAGAAEACRYGFPGEGFYWEVTPQKLAAAGIDAETIEDATRLALADFESVRVALG